MTPMAPHRLLAGSLTLATLLLGAAPAFALSQPDGTTIPAGNGLQGLFTARGEAIDALAQASTTPETFKPSCALTFEVLQRNAGYQNSFGWYNVTGSKPSVAELHEFLTCNDGVGVVKTLDIKNDPAYLGGEVAFYQATGGCATLANYDYLFFSEPAWNPDGNAANPFIHLLIYNSTVTAKAFYFGWEDLLSGGDNDFDDLTTFVTGITCSGGGGACQTGLPGICGPGTMQCQSGVLTCVQTSQPGSEVCNGVDDDCNGPVDEGDDICPNDTVCDQGSCVPKCNNDEFPCPSDKVCSPKGLCVDSECLDTNCPAGTKCDKGQCVAPCDGVVCPHGQVCVVGACIDPCAAITCVPPAAAAPRARPPSRRPAGIARGWRSRAADREGRAVQRVHQARLGLGLRAVADLRAPRLEVAEVRAARDLPVVALPRQPHLEIVRLLRARPEIAVRRAHTR
jgi:hypothetical protein